MKKERIKYNIIMYRKTTSQAFCNKGDTFSDHLLREDFSHTEVSKLPVDYIVGDDLAYAILDKNISLQWNFIVIKNISFII